MKNIIIIGVGRTGKTTLSNMIKDKYKQYNLIHSDSIKWAIIRAKGMEGYYKKYIKDQKNFEYSEEFQTILLELFLSLLRNDKSNYGYILESGQLMPRMIKKYIDFNNTDVYCLGHGDMSKEDILTMCRIKDNKNDWTFGLSDEELLIHIEEFINIDNKLKEECRICGIKYIDTSKSRDKVLNSILDEL